MSEQVNHPSHYQGKMECIDAMVEQFGMEKVEDFCEINAFKYLWRAGEKEGNSKEQDEAKARWYTRKRIDLFCERHQYTTSEEERQRLTESNMNYYQKKIKELKGG